MLQPIIDKAKEIAITRRDLTFLFSMAIIAGLFTTRSIRVLSSLGSAGLLANALIDIDKPWKQIIKKYGGIISLPYLLLKEIIVNGLIGNFITFFKSKVFLSISIIFFIHLLSYFQTDFANSELFWPSIQRKASLLVLPFCYAVVPSLTKKQFHHLLFFFCLLLLTTCGYSVIVYLENMDSINQGMSHSKPFPVPGNHVRFSLMVTLGVFCSLYLFKRKYILKFKWERYFQLAVALFLVFFLHLASVRSGMANLYFIIIALVFYFTFRKGKWLYGISTIVILITVSIASYFMFPTIRNKVDVTLKDLTKVEHMAGANYYPMSARIFSYKVGFEVFKKNPLLGVGIANLQREVKKVYISDHSIISNHILPHNQYLRYLSTFGIIGLIIFLYTFYYPLFYKRALFQEPMLLIHYTIVSISFLFEGTLETQMGLNFCAIFILIALSSLQSSNSSYQAYDK